MGVIVFHDGTLVERDVAVARTTDHCWGSREAISTEIFGRDQG